MPLCYANVPNRKPLLSTILVGEGALSQEQVDRALRFWFAQRKESTVLPFGEIVIKLGLMTRQELKPYVTLQKAIAAPPQAVRYLGVILIENRLITPTQLAEALKRQQETGQRLGEVLIAGGWVKKHQLAPILRLQGRKFTNRLMLPPGTEIP